ncbi:MAG: DNA helicase, partial [Thermomicrobiales bacterium]|nr:DNA helicase [Thermomicrobiales bacterium]
FKAFDSLFLTLLGQTPRPPLIQFAESFRLHREMADFLRENIYRHDGIDFRSRRDWRLAPSTHPDPLVAAALSVEHPLVVITHDERASQLSNAFERDLILDLSNALYDERIYGTGEKESDGFGIVVPHRAQRAAFSSALLAYPDRVGNKPVIADTVERFQGDEREVIIVSATESDPSYLLAASGFLLEPRRLTVALSRAKRKLILVASSSIFELFSPDEETFANAQLWKNLLKRTCTEQLWTGERFGHAVTVWGSGRGTRDAIE